MNKDNELNICDGDANYKNYKKVRETITDGDIILKPLSLANPQFNDTIGVKVDIQPHTSLPKGLKE